MGVRLVHENDVEELALPGRNLRWLVTKDRLNAQYLSMCVIRVAPGETVKPAHCHPNGEEVIYIIQGHGRVLVDGATDSVKEGTAVLFPQGQLHMLQNTGPVEMKVACFFAPQTDLSNYKLYENVEFPE
jgi:quercetin dioxygenase-like cupin family protein